MTSKKLTILQSSQLADLETHCNLILEYDGIMFIGVINYLGNLIAGGFKKGITPMGDENMRRMMFMQLTLDLSMRKEYDELFGPVDYVVSKRGKITKISIPMKKHMIVLITDKGINYESVIKKINNVFRNSLGDF